MRLARKKEKALDSDQSELESSDASSESRDNSSKSSDNDFSSQKKNIQKQIRLLSTMMKENPSVATPKIMIQREKLCVACEKLMQNASSHLNALNLMWKHCWYEPIKACISKPLSNDQKVWLKTFIGCGVGHFNVLIERHAELEFLILIFIGDLYRYSYANCDKSELDFRLTKYFYLKAAKHSNATSGRSFNQLALLCQEAGHIWSSLNFFLKALIVEDPFQRATDNIKRLNEFEFGSEQGHQIVFNLICSSVTNFSRMNFEKWRTQYENLLDALIKEDNRKEALESVYYISNFAIFILKSKVSEEQTRTIGALCCQTWSTLLSYAKSVYNPFAGSTKTSDKINEIQSFFYSTLTGLTEMLSKVSDEFTKKKIPVSLKFQYQNVTQMCADLLNVILLEISAAYLSLPDKIVNDADSKKKQNNLSEWIVNAPYCKNVNALVFFVKICTENATTPISYDGEKFLATNGSDKDLQFLEKISKIHSEFVQKEENKKNENSLIPIYLFPDQRVLVDKLLVLQNLVNTGRFTIIIVESVLHHLDGLKRESAKVRESIRWLQNSIVNGHRQIKMSQESSVVSVPPNFNAILMSVEDSAIQYLKNHNLLDRQSLFGTILTKSVAVKADDEENVENVASKNASKYKSLSTENIDAFFLRIVQFEDKTIK